MTYTQQDIDRAVAAGALSPAARDALLAFLDNSEPPSDPDAEQFRLLTGFNDIFVALACLLLLVPLAMIGSWWSLIAGAGLAWALSEWFTRRRRMALPAIVLLIAFGLFSWGAASALMQLTPFYKASIETITQSTGYSAELRAQNPNLPRTFTYVVQPWLPAVQAIAALVALTATALHWRRFRVPVTLAAGCAALVATLLFAASFAGVSQSALLALAFLCGLSVFALAMRFDMKDRTRTTRQTDIAFWLHLLAAPLVVHPLFQLLGGGAGQGFSSPWAAPAAIAVFLLLVLVALAIDRRAFLVASLAYMLSAIVALFRMENSTMAMLLSALFLGGLLVSLSAGWPVLRRTLLQRLPVAWRARLPAHQPG